MKGVFSMLMAAVMAITLAGCTRKAPQETPPEIQPPVTVDPVDPETWLCAALEGGRLYAQPLSGEQKRPLTEARCYGWDRRGDQVIVAFGDNTIRSIDLSTGEEKLLYTAPTMPHDVWWCDSGFVYVYMTMSTTVLYHYNTQSGVCTELLKDNFYSHKVSGDTLYYCHYDPDADKDLLTAVDLSTGQERWQVPLKSGTALFLAEDTLYAEEPRWTSGTGIVGLYTVDAQTGEMTAVEQPYDVNGYMLQYVCRNGFFVRSIDEGAMRFVHKDGAFEPISLTPGSEQYTRIYDSEGDTVLLGTVTDPYVDVLDEHIYYSQRQLYLLNTATGECTQIDPHGEESKLFADGDFPVLDSSTARKPITRAVYSLFCLESGAGGSMPVCNTTHGAWLALADKTSDIALLAAPTAEEEAYLKEKNVDVEMKLYGGDGLVFIVNRACGVENLTLEQVRAIYRGEITNWSQLGGADAPIVPCYRDEQSGSQRLFQRMVWADEEMPDFAALGFQKEWDMSTIVDQIVSEPYGIGYSIMTYLRDVYSEPELVALSLNGAEPTPENVASGAYPLGTKGYVVIRSDEMADSPARRLFDWFGCPLSDQILTDHGVTPLSE